jgi:hypothetical protein
MKIFQAGPWMMTILSWISGLGGVFVVGTQSSDVQIVGLAMIPLALLFATIGLYWKYQLDRTEEVLTQQSRLQ